MSNDLILALGLDPEDLQWHDLALCRGMEREDFFDGYEVSQSVARTTDEVCLSCPVMQACLKQGLDNNEYGVWGSIYLTAGNVDPHRNAHKTKDVWDKIKERLGDSISG